MASIRRDEDDRARSDSQVAPETPAVAPSAPRRRPKRRSIVLIADDTTDTRELYAEFLRSHGFTVITANDGAKAVDAALEHLPDVIVMDLAMPQFDGITAIRRIKSDARTLRSRVILLTGYPHQMVEMHARQAGADRYLIKPCLPETLARHINGLRRKREPSSSKPMT
jgi:two-component system, cell cycle response regulator DivK